MIIVVCGVIWNESERHHSIGSPMDGAQPSSKTDRDHLMKDNPGCYCLNVTIQDFVILLDHFSNMLVLRIWY